MSEEDSSNIEKNIKISITDTLMKQFEEIYYIKLDENYYTRVYPKDEELLENGNYKAAVRRHFDTHKILNETLEINNFLQPEYIKQKLSQTDSIEMRYKRRNQFNTECMMITKLQVCEKKNGRAVSAIMSIRSYDGALENAEHMLRMAEEKAEYEKQISLAKSEYLARIAHDVRIPLNSIMGMTGIARSCSSDKIKGYLDSIDFIVNHISEMMADVVDMSRTDEKSVQYKWQKYDLNEFSNVVDMVLTTECDKKNIAFVTIYNGKLPTIMTDRAKFNQLVINLLCNAVKYTPAGGKVEFTLDTREEKDKVSLTITIKDNGIGMSKEFMDVMYKPFAREHDDSQQTGSGLGLAIVNGIIHKMGGNISCESEAGKGTQFTVKLMFDKAIPQKAAEDETNIEGMRILAAEDDTIGGKVLKELLDIKNAVADMTEDGLEAVKRFEASQEGYYDVIILDSYMPVLGGIEAAKRIRCMRRADAKEVKLVLITGDESVLNSASQNSDIIDAVLLKPYNSCKLYSLLSKLQVK